MKIKESFKRDLKLKILLNILKIYTHIFVVDLKCVEISDAEKCFKADGSKLLKFDNTSHCTSKHVCSNRYGRYNLYIRNSTRCSGHNVNADSELGCYLLFLKRVLTDGHYGLPLSHPFRRGRFTKGEKHENI